MPRFRLAPLFLLAALAVPLVAPVPASAAGPALDAYGSEYLSSAMTPGPEVRRLLLLKKSGDGVKMRLLTSRFGDADPDVSAFVHVAGEAAGREVPLTLTKRTTSWYWGGDVLTLYLDGSDLSAEEYLMAVKVANTTNGTRTTAMVPMKVTESGRVMFFPEVYLSFASTGYWRDVRSYYDSNGRVGGDVYPGSATPYVGDGW